MATNFLQSLLGEDEYENARQQAINSGILSAGLQMLAGSGPSFVPPSVASGLGMAGVAGLQGYQGALQGAERQALRGMEFQELQRQREADDAFKVAIQGVVKDGKIDYGALQKLALAFPEKTGSFVSALKATMPPTGPAPVNLQFDPKTGTVFNPRTGEVRRIEGMEASQEPKPTIVTVEEDGKPVQKIIDLNTGKPIADVGAKPGAQKEPTEGERTAAGYLNRMNSANQILTPLEAQGQYPMYGAAVAGAIPFVGDLARNLTMPAEQQRYQQAANDWIRAKLRKESGAVIGADEMRQEYQTYFPQPGDSKEVIAQKQRARDEATKQMELSAGKAARLVAPQQGGSIGKTLQDQIRAELERRKRGQ